MTDPKDTDAAMEQDYDEEADSDFDAADASDDVVSSSSEPEADQHTSAKEGHATPRQRPKKKESVEAGATDLDSGDEATIEEKRRERARQRRRGNGQQGHESDSDETGWRVTTRARGEKAQAEKRKARLASVKGSTIDVDKIWEDMNRPGRPEDFLRPKIVGGAEGEAGVHKENTEPVKDVCAVNGDQATEQLSTSYDASSEMVTIDETYEYAGEVHHRKRILPRSSAQAKLWLSRRPSQNTDPRFSGDEPVRRPLRKISRFDPNINNLDPFRQQWEKAAGPDKKPKIDKLNTVEKSKMDWAAHVDQEGLQDELVEHARTKGAYLARMEFLGQVEQKKIEMGRKIQANG